MRKSKFTPAYDRLRGRLVALRKAAGMTQRDLARKLQREPSFVARIEQGERRLDIVELCWVLKALKAPIEGTLLEVIRDVRATDRELGK